MSGLPIAMRAWAGCAMAALAIGGCGGDDPPATRAPHPQIELPDACRAGTMPLGFAAGRLVGDTIRVVYANSGSLPPCAIYVQSGRGGTLEVELRVPKANAVTDDIHRWCAEVAAPSAPAGTRVVDLSPVEEINRFASRARLASGKGCSRVPYYETG